MSMRNDSTIAQAFVPAPKMFEQQAESQPNKLAVVCGGQSLTYGELNARANRVAHFLIANGVKAETCVGVLLERGVNVYVARQGILKSGGAFVVASPEYPEDRVRYIFEDSATKFVLTTRDVREKFSALWETLDCKPLLIDELIAEGNDENPRISISEHDLCYCIYTSGSTGKPKGVMIEHGNLFNFLQCNEKNYETTYFVEHSSVVLALAAMTFDMSIMEEFIGLTSGRSIVMATEEEIENPDLLAETMLKYGVDGVLATPSYLLLLLDLPKSREALKNVRVYDVGAEAFVPKLYDKITALRKDALILNGYGPTEATISCTVKVVTSGENITIGVPNANVYAYIIDDNGNELPDGEVGELLICGKGVGRGYVNLPERTAQSFITFRGMRGYKSGDLACINPEGEIEFHGRKDNQVKLRGLRIELGEIESVINTVQGITNSIVLAVDNQYLCAYYTATRAIAHEELSAYCAERLAYYMVPDVFIQLEEMPLTQNKKIDKKALPKPLMKQSVTDVPKNSTQQKIYDIFVEVTGNPNVGINTDFYRAGLSSLGAMQFNVHLAEAFGVVIKTSDINRNNTIVLLEQFLQTAPKQTDKHEVREVYPLTGSQKGIFVECEKNPESVIYNIPFLFTLENEIDLIKLQAAVTKTVAAHSYMNTRYFVDGNGELCQKPHDEEFVPDIINLSDSQFQEARSHMVRPFNLAKERAYRIEIYQTESHKYMLLDFHHIMTDGNSYDIFFEDLSKAYLGETLQPEGYTGFDAALTEEAEIANGNYKKSLLYYDSVFAGLDVRSLPLFDKKESKPTKGFYKRKLQITTQAADALCANLGVTLNTLFTGVFGIVAARYANAYESLFATIYNGRNDSRLANTVCMLVKTLPVYCKFERGTSLSSYLSALQEQLLGTMANDIVPFADISAKYGITSDLLFAYQAELSDDLMLANTLARGEDLSLDLPKEPMLLQVRLYNGDYYLTVEYRSDLYNEDTIQTLSDAYDCAMLSALHCRNVCDISLLSAAQKERLDSFNQTEVPYDTTKTVVDMFMEAAQANAQATAVVYQNTRLSYAQLERVTRNLAGYLITQGLKKEEVVAVLIPRCEYMPIAALGAARAGCAYQPLDYTYPQERLQFMVQDAGAKLLITTREMQKLLPDFGGNVLFVDEIPNLPDYDKPLPQPAPQDLFILLYTSGSTGVPKGCMLEYGNITAFCRWYHRYYHFTNTSRLAGYASFGFDACMMDLFCALTVGGQLHIIPEDMRLDLLALNDYFDKNQITHAFMTTQVGRQFATFATAKHLSYLSIGGEKLVPVDPPKGFTLCNVYGPTECTVFTTTFPLDRYYDDIPIGKPLDNLKLYVVDSQGHRLPVGACGELLIAGRQVSRGYLNRPEKTGEVYTSNPYSNEEGYERMYHSGDIVRYLADGNIAFVGRRDAQIKIRGFRIELTEVEEVIRRYPAIKDATVAAFNEEGGGKYIAAYVVSDEKIDVEKLNNFILETKPPYMVPAVTMQIDKIPLNQNQKVNKRALPKPEKKIEEKVAPKTEMQKRIFDCVAEAIGNSEFGVTTDIYYAGLTSVSAIRLNVLLAKAFDVVIKTCDLKNNPTVLQLEKFILGAGKAEVHEQREVYPLTATQYGIFIDSTANMGTTVYNIPYLFQLDKSVDLTKLKHAIEQTVQAHPYLKVTLFMDENGNICQKRNDSLPYEVTMVEGLDLANIVRPFNLFNESLFRFELYTAYNGSYLFIDLHHIVADGSSLAILLEDINRAYAGEQLQTESYTSYDVALDQEKLKNSQAYQQAEEYYQSIFKDCKGNTDFYPDRAAGVPQIGNLKRVSKAYTQTAVQALCKQYGITENVFFIGCFGTMLAKYNHEENAVFTTIYHGRNDSRLTDTVGMLVKTLPVLCNTAKDKKAYFADLQTEMMGMMDNDIYPFAEVSRAFHIQPNAMVIYQGESFSFNTIGGKPAQEVELQLNAAKAPVSLSISCENGHYAYALEYRNDMFDSETMDYLLQNFDLTITALLAGCAPQKVQLLFSEETAMQNNPAYMGKTFVDLFQQAVQTYPDRTAVIDEKGSITYAELDKMSDYLAEKLVKNGFGTEQVAGVLCGRTREFVIAVIGIMKAGGAYMPLDPEYPQDRLSYMLSDSGSQNLLAISEYVPLVGSYDKNVIYLDELEKESKTFQKSVVFPHANPENLAYMIYTSGSTGKPKGVMLEQRNLVNLIEQIVTFHKTVPEDRYGEFSSFCFDASVHDLFAPLTAGAALYIFPESIRKDAVEVCRTLQREGITVLTMPTQMGELIAETLTGDCALRLMTLGGEKFKRYYDRKYIMVNGYGPTENTVSSTEFVVDKEYKNIPIGKSQLNVRCYVVDENFKRVPVGASGELCLAGRQIARGYHNLPEKTAAAFIPNPFALNNEEARLYRTGDMVRQKGDGNLEYIGRIDNQIKIRGYRVELSEIEGAILQQQGVGEVAVIAIDQGSAKYIAAYYTGKTYADEEWQTFLKPLLPEYMLPTYYIHLEAMPITPGGKIDKRALPKPTVSTERAGYVAPETSAQKTLCELFAKALGIELVGIDDDFFALGGTSLTASKVAILCLNKKIPLVYADIFKYPTVRQLVEIVYQDQKATATTGGEFGDYAYAKIDKLLAANDVRNVDNLSAEPIGNILLTGATGFLGIHILREYLTHYQGVAYCLVRKGTFKSPERRLKNMLMYYFDSPFDELFGDRIICLDGDITDATSLQKLKEIPFDTLLNCAACVKHFADKTLLETINVKGVENLIDLCKTMGKKLIQISTVSVGGEGIDGTPAEDKKIREKDLYFNQRMTNDYIRTKFLAERAVLAAVCEGLNGKVIRVGNLMSRHSDGEFQINFITNGFLRTLRGYVAVGKFPLNALNESVEFSPIDETATAVLKLAGVNSLATVFHATNSHRIFMGDVVYAMREYGFAIDIVTPQEFERAVKDYAAAHENSDSVSGLIAYASREDSKIYTIDYDNAFTTEVLYRLGYKWHITDDTYLKNAIKALDNLDFFNDTFYCNKKEEK